MSHNKLRLGLASAALAVTAGGFAVIGLAGGGGPATAAVAKSEGTTYTVAFSPLNAGVHPGFDTVPTAAVTNGQLTLKGNDVTITFVVDGVTESLHPQHIHAGLSCPGPEADTNGDGYVDVIEGLPAYGPILVNLDSDLSSNAAGSFPSGHHYTYDEMASRSTLQDEIGTAIKLGRRHIVVHGFAGTVPSSVQTLPGLPASTGNLVLPVACGEIQVVGR